MRRDHLTVVDSTATCVPMSKLHPLRVPNIDIVVVHRLSLASETPENPEPIPDDMLNAAELARRFESYALGTGGQPPYQVLVRQDGIAEQVLPLLLRGAHAANYNWCSWGVAVAGNWDVREMPDRIWTALIQTVAVLSVVAERVEGHTELPNASRDPSKRCPGRYVNMPYLRRQAASRRPHDVDDWDIRRRLAYVTRAGFAL